MLGNLIEVTVLTGEHRGWTVAGLVECTTENCLCLALDGEIAVGSAVRLPNSVAGVVRSVHAKSPDGFVVKICTTD